MKYKIECIAIVQSVMQQIKPVLEEHKRIFEEQDLKIKRLKAGMSSTITILKEIQEFLEKDEVYDLECETALNYIWEARSRIRALLEVHADDA